MTSIARYTMLIATLAIAPLTTATDFEPKGYHADNCMQSHGTHVYTKLFPDDLALLVGHLNNGYYKFAE